MTFIEWCETGLKDVTTVSTVVIAICAVAGVIIAALGLYTWRRELHGRAVYDLARRVLLAVHTVREAVRHFRQIFSQSDLETWQELLSSPLPLLSSTMVEAEVMWPGKLTEAKKAMDHCLSRVILAILDHNQEVDKSADERDGVKFAADERILWSVDPVGDEFGQELDCAVDKFETALRPLVKT